MCKISSYGGTMFVSENLHYFQCFTTADNTSTENFHSAHVGGMYIIHEVILGTGRNDADTITIFIALMEIK